MGIYNLIDRTDKAIVRYIGVTRTRRLGRFLVGVIPALGCISMISHCGTLLMGFDLHIAAFLFKYSLLWWMLMTILSIAFEFCWVHRAFCAYNYIIGVLIEHQRINGFGEMLDPLRWFFLVAGILLIIAFVQNRCWMDFFEHSKKYK